MSRSVEVALFIFLAVVCVFTQSARADVWPTENQWNDEYERKFSQFIANMDMNIFSDPESPFYGIRTDCADAAYALRIIFAAKHRLPVAFYNKGTGKYDITNENIKTKYGSNYRNIKNEANRIKAFIVDVSLRTTTSSLVDDTYPVQVTREAFQPGIMFIQPRKEVKNASSDDLAEIELGHVYYVSGFKYNSIAYFGSTTPRMVRPLTPRYQVVWAPVAQGSGFRAWRQPGKKAQEHKFYGNDQYKLAGWKEGKFVNRKLRTLWTQAVYRQLRLPNTSARDVLEASFANAHYAIQDRMLIVDRAWEIARANIKEHGKCMSASTDNNYSTPSRDNKLRSEFRRLDRTLKEIANSTSREVCTSEMQYASRIIQEFCQRMANTKYHVHQNEDMSFWEIRENFVRGKYKYRMFLSGPHQDPRVRWDAIRYKHLINQLVDSEGKVCDGRNHR